MTTRRSLAALVFGAAVVTVAGKVANAQPVPPYPRGYLPPPALRGEPPPPPPPGRAFIWRPGHWVWNGYSYSWEPGHYVRRGRHWHRWVDGHWAVRGGTWVWIPGHWV